MLEINTNDKTEIDNALKDGKNNVTVLCSRCPSIILKPGFGTYLESEFKLPEPHHKSETSNEFEYETIKHYWLIKDMYHFENIGFSKDVENLKYLICADCEIGPIGYHDKTTKENFIALNRVRYKK